MKVVTSISTTLLGVLLSIHMYDPDGNGIPEPRIPTPPSSLVDAAALSPPQSWHLQTHVPR